MKRSIDQISSLIQKRINFERKKLNKLEVAKKLLEKTEDFETAKKALTTSLDIELESIRTLFVRMALKKMQATAVTNEDILLYNDQLRIMFTDSNVYFDNKLEIKHSDEECPM